MPADYLLVEAYNTKDKEEKKLMRKIKGKIKHSW